MPGRGQSSVIGLRKAERNFIVAAERMKRVTGRWIKRSTERLEKREKKNASLTDHSLPGLRRLGHPYARSRPGINAAALGHEPWLVHRQTGTLLRAIGSRHGFIGDQAQGQVFVDEAEAPHARLVIQGTPTMHPRDFLNESLNQIADQIGRDLIRILQREIISLQRVSLTVAPEEGVFVVEATDIGTF